MQPLSTIILLMLVSLWGYALPLKNINTNDSLPHKKVTFVHSVEIGGLFNVGKGKIFFNDHIDPKFTATGTPTGVSSKPIMLRMEHGLEFSNHLQTGISAGGDIFIEGKAVQALVPIMAHIKYTVPIKGKVLPMLEQRIGYAFYFHKRTTDPAITYQGVEGGAASETLIGVALKNRKKVTPQLMFGYRFQHVNSKTVFHAGNTLVGQTGLPDEIKITTNSLQHFLYLSLGLKF